MSSGQEQPTNQPIEKDRSNVRLSGNDAPAQPRARALDGKIVTPEHARFDEVRRAWNLTVDQQPAAVVFPESAEDVAAAVLFAREHRLRVAPPGDRS